MATSSLEAKNLVKQYRGRPVVDRVSFNMHSGEVVGLLGPNGAGKTTSFYMVVGLVAPDAGDVLLNGKDISKDPMYLRARAGLGYLPQEPSVFRKLTVRENILAILETIDGLSRHEIEERASTLLEEFGLKHVEHNIASALSGGERRRVEITRALARNPSFILLDEPFAGIDPLVVGDIKSMINRLKSKGIGVLITDHNVRETLEICDRAYILVEGHILEEGSPQKIAQSERARQYYLGQDFRL